MCLWHRGKVSVSHAGDNGFKPSNLFKIIIFLSLNLLNSVKTFRENSIVIQRFNLLHMFSKIGENKFLLFFDSESTIKSKFDLLHITTFYLQSQCTFQIGQRGFLK